MKYASREGRPRRLWHREGRLVRTRTPTLLGNLLWSLLRTELVKGLGEGLGNVGGIPIFNVVPMQHEYRLTIAE